MSLLSTKLVCSLKYGINSAVKYAVSVHCNFKTFNTLLIQSKSCANLDATHNVQMKQVC